MALTATCVLDVRSGGSDANNGGGFDPGQTAGMLTDGAATSATGNSPVFTSASYSFVAGDVGAWVFIASGTNWTAGYYEIASVSGGGATLKAAVGEAVLIRHRELNTAAGCATVASPTTATWSIDYSRSNAAQYTYTDITYVSGTTFTSAAHPFGKEQVGNIIQITGGTNFTTGHYIITSVTGVTATFNATACSGASSNGAGGQGGCLASPGKAGSIMVSGNLMFVNFATYTITSSSSNVAGGRLTVPTMSSGQLSLVISWNTIRTINNLDSSRSTFSAGAVTGITLVTLTNWSGIKNFIVDGATGASNIGISGSANLGKAWNCKVYRCPGNGIQAIDCYDCEADTCAVGFANGGTRIRCVASACTSQGFTRGVNVMCISYANSSHGFYGDSNAMSCIHCTADGNTGDGFRYNTDQQLICERCVATNNGGYGFNGNSSDAFVYLRKCATYNNTSGATNPATRLIMDEGAYAPGSDPITNRAGEDFSVTSGSNLRGISYAFPGTTATTTYDDIGAVQHQDAGSSGGLQVHPGMVGGMRG